MESTLFAELFPGSQVLDFVSEEQHPDGQSTNVTVRVLDKRRWDALMVELLLTQYEDDETFGVAIKKEYYIDTADGERVPKFSWVLTFWGEMQEAVDTLGPLIQKRVGPPPPPASVSTVVKKSASSDAHLQKTVRYDEKGLPLISVVAPLPHRASKRNSRPRSDRGKGATAELLGFTESGPSAMDDA